MYLFACTGWLGLVRNWFAIGGANQRRRRDRFTSRLFYDRIEIRVWQLARSLAAAVLLNEGKQHGKY